MLSALKVEKEEEEAEQVTMNHIKKKPAASKKEGEKAERD